MSYTFWIYLTVGLLSITCSLLGSFLVLKKNVMISDAISHSVLPGLVLGFLVVKDLYSPYLLMFSILFGLITIYGVDWLVRKTKVKREVAISTMYTLLFSIGILLISNFTSTNTDFHQDCILYGDLGSTPINKFYFNGNNLGPKSIWTSSTMLFITIIFFFLFKRQLVIETFEKNYAQLGNQKPKLINFMFMTLVSGTVVLAFDLIGAILIVSLLAVPGAISRLFFHSIGKMLTFAVLFGLVISMLSTYVAIEFNLIYTGSIALGLGLSFLFILFGRRLIGLKD